MTVNSVSSFLTLIGSLSSMYGNWEENIPTGDIQKSFKTRQSVSTHPTLTTCPAYSTVIKKFLLQECTSKVTRLLQSTAVQPCKGWYVGFAPLPHSVGGGKAVLLWISDNRELKQQQRTATAAKTSLRKRASCCFKLYFSCSISYNLYR